VISPSLELCEIKWFSNLHSYSRQNWNIDHLPWDELHKINDSALILKHYYREYWYLFLRVDSS
jgi:hypothetical protein